MTVRLVKIYSISMYTFMRFNEISLITGWFSLKLSKTINEKKKSVFLTEKKKGTHLQVSISGCLLFVDIMSIFYKPKYYDEHR